MNRRFRPLDESGDFHLVNNAAIWLAFCRNNTVELSPRISNFEAQAVKTKANEIRFKQGNQRRIDQPHWNT